ncbi:Ff.00g119780.m01.CDS01 [Fusarium sp. VM40]|nr:Ff.00g119780.m01.CDS01 [Fusarium sp. VM40]
MASNAGLFSFSSQTEPSTDLLAGSSWATTVEGSQNFRDFSDNGSAHSGEAEEFIFTSGHATPRGTRVLSQGNWSNSRTIASVTQGGQAMSRVSSSRSSGSSLSQSSHLSNMDFTGNASALQTGNQAGATMHGIDTCLLDPIDGIENQMYWPGYSFDGGLNGDATFSLPGASPLHVVPSHMQHGPDVSLAENSPPSPWDCFSSSISRSSSPNTIEDLWFPNQSPNSSPQIQCQSPSKFVDSHLKPYRCKAESCEGARFSSTACLLRHEREAHGLHGHGDKPFLCVYEGCERAVPGNGFPRQWNLRDHMKRVHNDHGSSSGSPTTGPAQPAKGRKRKTETSEAQTSNSRKAAVKSMPPPPEPKENLTQPLLDQWMEHRKAVESLMRSVVKPEDAQNLQHIGTMQSRLNSMMKLTTDLNAINNPGNTLVGTG